MRPSTKRFLWGLLVAWLALGLALMVGHVWAEEDRGVALWLAGFYGTLVFGGVTWKFSTWADREIQNDKRLDS